MANYNFTPPPNGTPVLPADKKQAEKNWRNATGPEVISALPDEPLEDRIERMSKKHGVSKNAICVHLGLNPASVHLWMNGKRKIPSGYREAFTNLFDAVDAGEAEMPKQPLIGLAAHKANRKPTLTPAPSVDQQTLDRIAVLENKMAKYTGASSSQFTDILSECRQALDEVRKLHISMRSVMQDQDNADYYGEQDAEDMAVKALRIVFRAMGVVNG